MASPTPGDNTHLLRSGTRTCTRETRIYTGVIYAEGLRQPQTREASRKEEKNGDAKERARGGRKNGERDAD